MRIDRARHKFTAPEFDELETREVLSHLLAPLHGPLVHPLHVHTPTAQVSRIPLAQHATPVALTKVLPAVPRVPVSVAVATTGATLAASVGTVAPMANLGNDLNRLYQAYLSDHGDINAIKAMFPMFTFNGDKVGINVRARSNTSVLASELTNLGMDVTMVSQQYAWVSGAVPISQLPAVAALPELLSASPNYKPVTFGLALNGSGLK